MYDSIEHIYDCFQKCTRVTIDSRTIKGGELFIAIKGPKFDGNQFVGNALEKGALFALADDSYIQNSPQILFVENTQSSLQELATFHRATFQFPIIGITGSNGKTTTKELISAVLACNYKTAATPGNYNNHLGVPLTILNTPKETEILVVEMGSNQNGDIESLCNLVEPEYGLITNIGKSHLEGLDSIEGVFIEKKALFDTIVKMNGLFFLNMGDPWLSKLEYDPARLNRYSKESGLYGKLNILSNSSPYLNFEITYKTENYKCHSHLTGSYNLENISAALSIGHYFKISLGRMIEAIANYKPKNMRSQVIESEKNIIFLDSYNANPTSMRASIMSAYDQYGASLSLILGDMLELGSGSAAEHRSLIDLLDKLKIKEAILVGKEFSGVNSGKYPSYQSVDQLIEKGNLEQLSARSILIKGSRGIQLEKIIGQL